MSLFSFFDKKNYLGIDLGAGGIKFVQLQNEKGRARLFTYAFTDRLYTTGLPSFIDAPKETAELLKQMLKKAKVSTKKAITGLPIASVFNSVVTVPKGSDKVMRSAIQSQVKKLIPVPIEEMVLDYKIIPSVKPAVPQEKNTSKPEKLTNIPVLVTGASRTMVKKYVTVFAQTGLRLLSLETEAFALVRSLIGKDRAATMIVDMGALRTNIIIVDNGIPYLTRSLDFGGAVLTKLMSKTLSLDPVAAEQMKTDSKGVSAMYPSDTLPKIFSGAINPLITELRYSLDLFQGMDIVQDSRPTIEKIVLTGGSASLSGLAAHISSRLSIKTYIGDPWARVVYADGLRATLDEVGTRFAVSIGLAMRDIE